MLKSREGTRVKSKLEIVYLDIAGPEAVEMGASEKYMLNLVDNFMSCSWTYTLKKKSIDVFKDWKALVESESSLKLSIICTDSGGEYTSNQFEAYLQHEGIRHQLTAPHTSAQNGKAERCHQTIMNHACMIQSDANLPLSLWGECVHAAGYLKKITTTRTLKDKTPHEAWYGRCPDVSHLHELGCHVWILVMDKSPKIYNRSIECKLIGYSDNLKAYCCWDSQTGCIHVT